MDLVSFHKSLGERIRELRKLSDLTQSELAKQASLTVNTVSLIECGKVSPKLETVLKLSLILDISPEELLDLPTFFPRRKDNRQLLEKIIKKLAVTDKIFLTGVLQIINQMMKVRNTEISQIQISKKGRFENPPFL